MKRAEVEEAMEARQPGERIVVRVEEHKTGFAEAAKIIFDIETEKMLRKWWRVLDDCNPDSQYVFPTFDGEKNQHMFRVISRTGGDLGYALPNSREVRVSVELKAKTLPAADKERVSRSMSHSTSTAEKYYRANLKEDCHRAFQSIQDILVKSNMPSSAAQSDPKACTEVSTTVPATSPAPAEPAATDTGQRRKKYTKREEEQIRAFFKKELIDMKAPTMQKAGAFLKAHNLPGRSKKDVYDKVRNMFRYVK